MAYGLNSAYRANPIWAIFVNKVLLALNHTHQFAYCLWLLSHCKSRVDPMSQSPYGPQRWKYLLSGPYRNILPSPATEAFIFPLRKRACEFSGVPHSLPLLPNTGHTKSRDWVLTSISEFSYLFNYISTFTFIKCVALPRSSLGTLHTYSDAAASVLDILGAALQSQVIWYLRKFPSPLFGTKVVQPCQNMCPVAMEKCWPI